MGGRQILWRPFLLNESEHYNKFVVLSEDLDFSNAKGVILQGR
jgi:hypothetical protein